jgi:type I restriction-modification system DNA methylase subunit
VILPHGVLFRGHAEANIRRNLVRQGYIKGIIGLPANLFYGTGIPACNVVLDKENAHARRGIFMIDASRGFMKDGNKNRLRSQDMHKIVDVFRHGPPIDEQIAIATALSDMDADITALEAQREKTRQVKQGMMQVLLTGRARLV